MDALTLVMFYRSFCEGFCFTYRPRVKTFVGVSLYLPTTCLLSTTSVRKETSLYN